MRSIEIIPDNTCPTDFSELKRRSELLASFAPHVQLDISDGLFSPVVSWPYQSSQWNELKVMAEHGEQLPYSEQMMYEAHLMVEDPDELGLLLIRMGAKRVMGHVEAFATSDKARKTLDLWRHSSAEVGLAVLFGTSLEVIKPLVPACDVVLMMSITMIGKQGAQYEPGILDRVAKLHAEYPDALIAVDGGVSEKNIADLVRVGVRRFSVGSAIMKREDPKAAYEELKILAEAAMTK